MRAIVTGGAGFIGSHLVERLAGEGYDLRVVDNLASGGARLPILERFGVTVDVADIRDESAQRFISDSKPDLIFHLAAQMDVRRSVADPIYDAGVNVIGLLRVLEAAKSSGAKVLFASSGGTIYGDIDPSAIPVHEEVVGRPSSPYGITKSVAEDYLRFYQHIHSVPFVSLALANVYGPRQDPHGEAGVVAIFGSRLLAGEPCVIYGDGKQTRDFVYVGDVVEAFMKAINRGEGETFNIGTALETSVDDLYASMAAICGVETDPRYEPERPGELRRIALDFRKGRTALGWSPAVSLDEGLGRTIEALRS